MAEIELFHYRKATGTLHLYNTGFKILSLIFLTVTIFKSAHRGLIILSLFITALVLLEYYQTHILSPLRLLRNIKGFLLFLVFIVIVSGMTIEGAPLNQIHIFSVEGLYSGLVYSWKLLLLIILGQLFTSTSDPVSIYGALYRLLRPVPLVNAGNAAMMVSLTITFIPLIFDQYLEVRNAVESRLGGNIRNPFKKVISLALPLLQTTLIRSDEMTQAMESRCYSDNPTLNESAITRLDVFILLSSAIFPLLIFC